MFGSEVCFNRTSLTLPNRIESKKFEMSETAMNL